MAEGSIYSTRPLTSHDERDDARCLWPSPSAEAVRIHPMNGVAKDAEILALHHQLAELELSAARNTIGTLVNASCALVLR